MPIKPELVKLRKQYGDAYIPDSDGAMSSESETVMTSVICEREVGFLLLNLAIGLIVFSYRHLHGQCPITLWDQSPITSARYPIMSFQWICLVVTFPRCKWYKKTT